MKKQHLRLISWFLLLTVFLSACSLEKPPEYTYREEHLRISEPYGSDFIFQGNIFRTSINGRTYEFHSSLTEAQRSQFISAQERLCRLLERNGISTAGQTYRVLTDYYNWTDSANQVAYFGLNMAHGWKQVLTTLQVSLGDYTNYGYLYALSNQIAADLNWNQDEISESASAEALSQNSRLLNLVYPCFDVQYTDTADTDACKLVAQELLSGLENIWSEEAFLQARLEYAQSKGLDFQPTHLRFAYYSPSCPLKIQTKYMEIFRDHTFQASTEFLNGYIKQDYMADIHALIHTFEWLDEQLTTIRGNFASFEMPEGAAVSVQLSAELPRNGSISSYSKTGSFYIFKDNRLEIYTTTVRALAYHYTRYLCLLCGVEQPTGENWHILAVANYLTLGGNFEHRLLYARLGLSASLETIREQIGQAFDEPMDEIRFLRSTLRAENTPYISYLKQENSMQVVGAAFGEYFARTYGSEAFLRCMLDASKTKDITGKTLDEVLNDWVTDMQDASKDAEIG